jgi:hypothetical protein
VYEYYQVDGKATEFEVFKIAANVEVLNQRGFPEQASIRIDGKLTGHH